MPKPLTGTFSGPPTQAEMEAFAAYVETLHAVLVRQGRRGRKAEAAGSTNAVPTLDTPFADPDSESLRVRMNELILAARR